MAENEQESQTGSQSCASGPNTARGVLVSALSTRGAAERLRQLDTSGFLAAWVPELDVLKGVQQPKEHYWDVYEHSVQTVAALEFVLFHVLPTWNEVDLRDSLAGSADGEYSRLVLLKLAALLHDVAKPQTKSFEPGGRMRFFGHAEVGAQIARDVMARLCFSVRAQQMVGLMVEHHLRPGQLAGRPETPTDRALFRFFRDTDGVGIETLLLNLADHKAMRGPQLPEGEWQQHVDRTRAIVDGYLRKLRTTKPAKLIDGREIMARFGLAPGPLVGELLSEVEQAQARGEISSKDEAWALAAKALGRHQLPGS